MTIQIVTAPAAEPITLVEAKAHLRVDDATSDTLIASYIKAARQIAEGFMRRSLVRRTLRLSLDGFPSYGCPLLLPFAPVASISSVKYYDSDGALQTWSSAEYLLEADSEPARLQHHPDDAWPTDLHIGRLGVAQVEYVAGYAPSSDSPTDYAANVPDDIKSAIKLILGDLYEDREDTNVGNIVTSLPRGAEALMWPHRILRDC